MRTGLICILACVVGVGLAGCETDHSFFDNGNPPSATIQNPNDIKYYPSDEPLKLGLEYFDRGDFGLAAKYFENSVTKAPEDATAWIGLAASYDRIGRFDLADRAYAQAIRLVGETPAILNNEGYSYMLRGRLTEARKKLQEADKRDPNNPTILNNLRLLDASKRYIRREQ